MKKLIYLTLVSSILYSTLIQAKDEIKDPFQSIEHIKLSNGLNVYLAPSEGTNLVSIKVNVDVGWNSENKANYGVSHLLEHSLFRDKNLQDEMSYLQLIKEKGGSANGYTTPDETSYFGSITSDKSLWLLETISKMIINPNITDENVQREKSTVELEIGRPGPITLALGFNPADYLWPSYLREKSFNETEFNIAPKYKFTESEEQLSNRKLTLNQILTQYNNYYYPSNMQLIVAGKFNKKEMMNFINSTWGKMEAREGLKMPPKELPKARLAPYTKTIATEENNGISVGIKATNYTTEEKVIIQSYMEYLSHRLMKELRNKKGQTYSANAYSYLKENYGYIYVYLMTPKEFFSENLDYIRNSIQNQATKGGLSDKEITEAKDLYLGNFALKGKEADTMLEYAELYKYIQLKEGKFTSPYANLKDVSFEKYNNTLKKFFKPEHQYEYLTRSSLLFAYDQYLMIIATFIISFHLLRKNLTKAFKHDHIRWVRKVKLMPLKSMEFIALTCGFYIFAHASFLISSAFGDFDVTQASFFMSNYFYPSLWIAGLLTTFQLTLSILPSKLMVMDDVLVIKSTSYYSRKIKLSDIESVETCRLFSGPITKWPMKVGMRFYYFNFKFWKKGLMINMKNGKSHFFSMAEADAARNELEKFLDQEPAYIQKKLAA